MEYSGIYLSDECLLQGPRYRIVCCLALVLACCERCMVGESRSAVGMLKCRMFCFVRYTIVHQVMGCVLELTGCVPVAEKSHTRGAFASTVTAAVESCCFLSAWSRKFELLLKRDREGVPSLCCREFLGMKYRRTGKIILMLKRSYLIS